MRHVAKCVGNLQQSARSAAHCSQASHQEVVLHPLARVGTLLNTQPELRSQHRPRRTLMRVNALRIPESSFHLKSYQKLSEFSTN